MSLFAKAKHAAQEFKTNWDASSRRAEENAAQAKRQAPTKPAKPTAAEQDRIRREGEWAVLNNQQQGLVD